MANPQLLPQEKIVKLPIKRIKVNKGDEIPAYYDEANGIVYIKKSDGEFGWAYVRSDSGVEVAPKAAETDEKGASGGESEKKSEEPAKKHEKKPKQKKEKVKVREDDGPSSDKKTRIVAGCIIVAVVCLILVYSSGLLSVNKKPGSPSTPAPAGDNSTLNLADKAAAETYNVLIVKKNIFRGNQITEDDLAVCEISKAEFAACGGAYTSDCTSAVVGLEATKFLPFGAILTFDSCSFKTSYSESPWAKTNDNQTYLDVPYEISVKNLYDWTPGDIVALTIYVDTTKSQSSGSDTNEVDGMQHTSSVSASTTTDTFKFSSIQIADLINVKGNSIFQIYANFYSVPIGFIPSILSEEYDEKTIQDFIPRYIRFVVTKDQKKAIGTLTEDAITVKLKRLNTPDASELPVDDYYYLTEYISKVVKARYTELEKAQKEAE